MVILTCQPTSPSHHLITGQVPGGPLMDRFLSSSNPSSQYRWDMGAMVAMVAMGIFIEWKWGTCDDLLLVQLWPAEHLPENNQQRQQPRLNKVTRTIRLMIHHCQSFIVINQQVGRHVHKRQSTAMTTSGD